MHPATRRLVSLIFLISLLSGVAIGFGGGSVSHDLALAQEGTPAGQPICEGVLPSPDPPLADVGEYTFTYPAVEELAGAPPETLVLFQSFLILKPDERIEECFPGQLIVKVEQGAVRVDVIAGLVRREVGAGCPDAEAPGCVLPPGTGEIFKEGDAFIVNDADFVVSWESGDIVSVPVAQGGASVKLPPNLAAQVEVDDATLQVSGNTRADSIGTIFSCGGGKCRG